MRQLASTLTSSTVKAEDWRNVTSAVKTLSGTIVKFRGNCQQKAEVCLAGSVLTPVRLQECRPLSHSTPPPIAQNCLMQKWGCLQHLQAKGCGSRKTAVQGGVKGNSNQGKQGWSESATLGGVS